MVGSLTGVDDVPRAVLTVASLARGLERVLPDMSLAQQMIKRAVHKSFEMPWTVLGEYQQAMGDVLWQTDDHMEGVHSFTERREPRFTGH